MDIVNQSLCNNCPNHQLGESPNHPKWYCISQINRSRQTIFKDLSKPPKHCPYREMTLEEALTDQIAERLF